MNVAIEYILRHGRVEQLLSLPCSLFLESIEKKKKKDILGGKMVITLMPRYGNDTIVVRKYILEKVSASDMLPSYEESTINSNEVFNHPNVVIPSYKLLEFQAQPFDSEEKQVNDLPLAAIQEKQYKDCLLTFFSPYMMNRIREDWLWICFDAIYIDDKIKKSSDVRSFYMFSRLDLQREKIKRDYKTIHKMWELWKRNLLYNSDPASELVFAKAYGSKFMKYVVPEKKEVMSDDGLAELLSDLGIQIPLPKKKQQKKPYTLSKIEIEKMKEIQKIEDQLFKMIKHNYGD